MGIYTPGELYGVKMSAVAPAVSLKNYFQASFQDSANAYIDEQFPLKPWYVRLHNDINFRLFRYTTAPDVIIGKDDFLFVRSYIDSYTGKNFIGEERIKETVRKIGAVREALKKKQIDLLIVFAPGKATYYAEKIPERFLQHSSPATNFNVYREYFTKSDIPFIDLNTYFLSLKSTIPYPLYPKYGTHWSTYALGIVADTIAHYIEHMRGIHLPKIDYSQVNVSDSLSERDYDVGILLNLLHVLPNNKMAYPAFSFKTDSLTTQPALLAVGDSYWHCLVYEAIPGNLFKTDRYWRYNQEEFIHNKKQTTPVKDLHLKEQVLQQDVVVMMATEGTLDWFPYGFIDKLYEQLAVSYSEKIQHWKEIIRNDKAWLEAVQSKAFKNHISLDSMLTLDAQYMINTEK